MAKRGIDWTALLLLILPGIVTFVTVYLILTMKNKMDSDTALGLAITAAVGAALAIGMTTYFLPQ
jgi:hypothetical protein